MKFSSQRAEEVRGTFDHPQITTNYVVVKDVKSTGAEGGTFTSGDWRTRDLNTVEGNSDLVTLPSNAFT